MSCLVAFGFLLDAACKCFGDVYTCLLYTSIRLSVPIIKDIIRAYRIPILEVPGYEAVDEMCIRDRRTAPEATAVLDLLHQ